MFRIIILFFLAFVSGFGFAQVKLQPSHHHFGSLKSESERFTDFILTNKSAKKMFILRIDADREISALISTKTLEPDSSATIRIQYNPSETGKINKSIGVYISSQNEPLQITLSGEVLELPRSNDLTCPSFNSVAPVNLTPSFVLNVKVIDKLTGEPIEKADVKLLNLGLARYNFKTNTEGRITSQVLIGYYYFVTRAEGYEGNELDAYINARNNNVLIELLPKDIKPIDPEPLDSLFYVVNPIPPIVNPGREDEWIGRDSLKPIAELPVKDSLPSKKDQPIVELPVLLDKVEFTEATFARNNIVFLIDISGSMLSEGKLELLKSAMISLTNTLRSVDMISIVVYASNARVILQPISADQKNIVIEKIQNLEAGGNTAGAEGMKQAYELALRNFIPGGNNIVIMATDGAFNLYTSDVGPMVKRYLKKGIHTSVIGIKNTERDAKSMQSIAALGAGRYIEMNNYEHAQSRLTEEIKIGSKR